jgi:hypothetical protein
LDRILFAGFAVCFLAFYLCVRSIAFDLSVKPDPLLLSAAQDAQLDIGSMFHHFLENAVMWIDPGEVVVRTTWTYSHRGTEETIFPASFTSQGMLGGPMDMANLNQMGAGQSKQPMNGMNSLQHSQGMPMPQPKLTSTANSKARHYSPPKSQANARGKDGHGKNVQGMRRPSDAKNQQADLSLNVYSSVFVPSSNYSSDYWTPHDRVGLTV